MKKLILLTTAYLFGITVSFGQAIKFSVLAGPNWSTFVVPQQANQTQTSSILGVHAGLFTEFTFDSLSVEPGLFYMAAGGKSYSEYGSFGGAAINSEYTVQYLQVPLNIIYNTPGRKFFFGGGPYAGFGLSGNISNNTTSYYPGSTSTMQSSNEKYVFSSSNNPDYGLNFVAGVHLTGGTMFSIGYGLGLRHSYYAYNFSTVRNEVFSVSIGHTIF